MTPHPERHPVNNPNPVLAEAIRTGINGLDDLLLPGRLIVVAGRYGHGADTVVTNIARYAAVYQRVPTLFASCRNDEDQVTCHMIAAQTGISLRRIEDSALDEKELTAIASTVGSLTAAPLHIETANVLPPIGASAKDAAAQLLVIEGAHLFVNNATVDPEERADYLSRELKFLAIRLGIPVVVSLPLLARDDEPAGNRPPVLDDLGSLWSFAGDADAVVLVHRPDVLEPEHHRAGEIDLMVAKHRHGRAVTVAAIFQEQYDRILNFPPQ